MEKGGARRGGESPAKGPGKPGLLGKRASRVGEKKSVLEVGKTFLPRDRTGRILSRREREAYCILRIAAGRR